MNCMSCGSETVRFLDLGHHPPSDAFLSNLEGPETHYPLNVHYCSSCGLVQLGYIVPPEVLFNNEYPYLTGSNEQGVKHFADLADVVIKRFKVSEKDLVVDVGSNDGTLLKGFVGRTRVIGIEPTVPIAKMANEAGIFTLFGWLDLGKFQAKVVTACNVFAHVADIHGLLKNISNILSCDGVFIIESPYLLDMIDKLEYDTIYHEHVFYWHYTPLQRLLGKYDLEVFDMERQSVHGGTMRYYIGRRGVYDRARHTIESVFEDERRVNIDYLVDFAENVMLHKKQLLNLMGRIKAKGKKIFGMSAPAKGNTLLNYCGIDNLEYITEINPLKVGKYTPGTHIPVIHESVAGKCEYALLLAWNWKDQIIQKQNDFIRNGGRFIIPIPEPKIEHIGSGVWAGYEL